MFADLALRCLVETYAASCEERNEEPLAKRIKNDKTEKEKIWSPKREGAGAGNSLGH